MADWKYVKSGRMKYYIRIDSPKDFTIRRADSAWSKDNGTRLGTASSLPDALSLIKADSGSDYVDVADV